MKKYLFPLLIFAFVLFSCNDDDDTEKEVDCQETNHKVDMSRFVKSDQKSNGVTNTYAYNELNLLSSRVRSSSSYVFEYDYVYDCSNNLIEIQAEETFDPQYDGSSSFYEYDEQNRLIAYNTSYQGEDDYSLSYEGNVVSVSGTIWSDQNASITLQLNSEGQVIRLDRNTSLSFYKEVKYTLFEYDSAGNLTKADDYDDEGNLIFSITVNYDSNINPYYDQFASVYIQRFVNLFYQSGFWAADVISSDEFLFPYLQNNIESVVDNLCNACYPEVVKKVYSYDEQSYPNKFSLSYWGAPGAEIEVEYFE